MIKQIVHIAIVTFLAVALLTSIARGQEVTYNDSEKSDAANEELVELMYKYDLPYDEELEEIAYEETPAPVKRAIRNSLFSDWEVAKAFRVEDRGKTGESYVVFLEDQGYIERLTITPEGKLVEE